MKKLLATLLFFFLLSPLFGTIYYVDATTGSDSDTGLTEDLAWQTWNYVRAQTFSAGDTIKFKRGETWTVGASEFWTFDYSGTADAYITIEDYGTGTKPILDCEIEMVAATWGEEASSDIEQLVNDDYWSMTTFVTQKLKVTSSYSVMEVSVLMWKSVTGDAHIEFWTEGTNDAGATMSGDSEQIGGDSAVVSIDQITLTWFDFAWSADCPHLTADCFLHIVLESGACSIRSSTDETDYEDTDYDLWRAGSEVAGHNDLAFKVSAAPIWSTARTSVVHRCRLDGQDSGMAANSGAIDGITYLWHWNTDDDELFVYATEDPSTLYTSIKIAYALNEAFDLTGCSYVKFKNLRIHGGKFAFWFHSTTDESYIEFDGLDIWYGYLGIYCIKTSGGGGTANYITVKNCDIDAKLNLIDKAIASTEQCVGDGVQVLNECNNWTIQDNTFGAWGHTSLNIKNAHAGATQGVNNCLIEGNTFDGSAGSYDSACDTSGYDGKFTNNVFRFNIIRSTTKRFQFGGNDNEFSYNLVYGMDDTPTTNKSDISQGIAVSRSGAGMACDGNMVHNNVFFETYNESIHIGTDATNSLVKNNICMEVDGGGSYADACLVLPSWAGANNIISNNCLYTSGGADVIDYEGTPETVAEADAGRTEFSSNVGSDPLMVDPANADFTLRFNSPCIDRGIDVDLNRDYVGNHVSEVILWPILNPLRPRIIRPINYPDIGAYEYQY